MLARDGPTATSPPDHGTANHIWGTRKQHSSPQSINIDTHHNTPGLYHIFLQGGMGGGGRREKKILKREDVGSFRTYIAQLKIIRSKISWMEVSVHPLQLYWSQTYLLVMLNFIQM